jgi:hypothetical protein
MQCFSSLILAGEWEPVDVFHRLRQDLRFHVSGNRVGADEIYEKSCGPSVLFNRPVLRYGFFLLLRPPG